MNQLYKLILLHFGIKSAQLVNICFRQNKWLDTHLKAFSELDQWFKKSY